MKRRQRFTFYTQGRLDYAQDRSDSGEPGVSRFTLRAMHDLASNIDEIASRYGLGADQSAKLLELADRCATVEISGTAIRDRDDALRLHVADSLAGLEVEAIRTAAKLCDIGTGVGLPGLALAVARPELSVTLVDAVRKKTEAASTIARALELKNIECVWSRVELLGALGSPVREGFDVVTARALAPLSVLIEYAGPLLSIGGSLVAWKGTPESSELADAEAAESELGFEHGALIKTQPFKGSRRRHFYVTRKSRACESRYPRREGVALRKPITAKPD